MHRKLAHVHLFSTGEQGMRCQWLFIENAALQFQVAPHLASSTILRCKSLQNEGAVGGGGFANTILSALPG